MILALDPARMAAFIAVTGLTSLAPGPQMVFVMTQAAWRGHRGGLAALTGAQVGAVGWFALAGLGLGGLAAASPLAFRILALVGASYLAWLGWQALSASKAGSPVTAKPATQSRHAFRDGLVVSLSNPKALVYVVALLPPFVRRGMPIAPQLVVLGAVAIAIDLMVGTAYILAGSRIAQALAQPHVQQRFNRVVGSIFVLLAIAAGANALRT
jgi:threonine/homoserine/homoserine lactone efflux protein